MTSGVDIMANRVTLSISSANPDAPDLIRAHLRTTTQLLAIESDGTGLELLPRGTIRGRVLDKAGRPVANLEVIPSSPLSTWCGDEVGHATLLDGTFELEHCAPTTWTVNVTRAWPDILGSAKVTVQPGKVAEVVIRVP
jgi:hypothetical protein